ncbi:hypothetical protein [Microbacterium hominis]|uniref:Uncharacterized protein n=1 Tax=Microbacterium hominis TaxID=162426 RepID=A0A7D4UJT6_9MICO|nr:hypothetical protein [Microbacterium hominis]QKJ19927.1 hypothetical protein HQM25_11555 [Microbacterium hominis]
MQRDANSQPVVICHGVSASHRAELALLSELWTYLQLHGAEPEEFDERDDGRLHRMADLQPVLALQRVQRLWTEPELMTQPVTRALCLVASLLVLAGCAPGEHHASTTPTAPPTGPAVAPTFDEESGLWLSDGWPVPDPHATFDPDAPWMSAEDASNIIVGCLRDKGWEVTVTGPGAFVIDTPDAQKDAYDYDVKRCYIDNKVGIDPPPPLTAELADSEYRAQVRTRDCLESLGLDVPSLPSYQAFSDALLVESRIIGIYALAESSGSDLRTDPEIWAACPDPLNTWGHNE